VAAASWPCKALVRTASSVLQEQYYGESAAVLQEQYPRRALLYCARSITLRALLYRTRSITLRALPAALLRSSIRAGRSDMVM